MILTYKQIKQCEIRDEAVGLVPAMATLGIAVAVLGVVLHLLVMGL
jgi:hypothetical protein